MAVAECEKAAAVLECKEMFVCATANLKSLATTCRPLATDKSLQLQHLYIGESIDEEKIIDIVNSGEAASLKAAWTPLVNMHDAFQDLTAAFEAPKFAETYKSAVVPLSEELVEEFAEVRDKICEIVGARGLTRPLKLKPKEEREVVVAAAKKTIKALGGIVSIHLGHHLGIRKDSDEEPPT